ncbi:MAG TPA: LysM peptidoglycan-binding domain-containing protein [Polyangia bacterium]
MAEASLDGLKLKYQSVLNTISKLGVQLQNLHVQDGKLVVRAHAKTQTDSNKVWEQIKLVDANYASDLAAQITYDTAAPAASAPAPAAAPQVRTYTVQKGDTLSEIAQKEYGAASSYRKIFDANRDVLSDPDKIRPGQVLKLPA